MNVNNIEGLPITIKKTIDQLPKTAGVYLFYSAKETRRPTSDKIIYIGKAINIKDRVKNHFQQPSYRDDLFIEKTSRIEYIETGSEIEALVLEAQLIKKHLPKYNIVWKDDKNYFYVVIAESKNKIPYVFTTHQTRNLDPKRHALAPRFIGPFIEGNALKKTLRFLRKVFPYYTSASHSNNKCTWCHLDLCPGSTPDLAAYKKNIKKLELILKGKRKTVFHALRKEMQAFSKKNQFEQAGSMRDKMNALQQVMLHTRVIENKKIESDSWEKTQLALQKILEVKNPVSKIECYDISNIQGKFAVGSMVVFVNGNPDRGRYKKFRIRMENKPNDIAMLKEVLTRRLAHPKWEYPQVMLIDGGIAQLNVAIRAKKSTDETGKIKIISIAKGKRELFIENQKKPLPLKNLPQEIYNVIVALDDEAHRFAIAYHKKVRKKALLDI